MTFKFQKGNWLLISHEGTGIENVPLAIKTQNAESRIKKVLLELSDDEA